MNHPAPPPIPKNFVQYIRSFGPGLVVVLTWLGAGDIVEMAVAGANYGYSLMWALIVAIVMRYLFVSLIAKYQLCNQHDEAVLDGLVRLSKWYAPMLFFAAIVMGHIYGSYMTVGIGEACANMLGGGPVWAWAVLGNGLALLLVFRPAYQLVENVFKVLLAVLSISFLVTAAQVSPAIDDIGRGLVSFSVPERQGEFSATLIMVGMIGAVGGSLMNLVYPYFLESKQWKGPEYRKLQLYDFLLAVVVMIVLDLSIWVLGAETGQGFEIEKMSDLQRLLGDHLSRSIQVLFFAGIFAVVFTSLVGHALGLACMGSHAMTRWRGGKYDPYDKQARDSKLYRGIVVWCLVSPLVWTIPGMPGFVKLTLVSNALQVLLLPFIAGGLLLITANKKYIGERYKNRLWENVLMVGMLGLAVWGAIKSIDALTGG